MMCSIHYIHLGPATQTHYVYEKIYMKGKRKTIAVSESRSSSTVLLFTYLAKVTTQVSEVGAIAGMEHRWSRAIIIKIVKMTIFNRNCENCSIRTPRESSNTQISQV